MNKLLDLDHAFGELQPFFLFFVDPIGARICLVSGWAFPFTRPLFTLLPFWNSLIAFLPLWFTGRVEGRFRPFPFTITGRGVFPFV